MEKSEGDYGVRESFSRTRERIKDQQKLQHDREHVLHISKIPREEKDIFTRVIRERSVPYYFICASLNCAVVYMLAKRKQITHYKLKLVGGTALGLFTGHTVAVIEATSAVLKAYPDGYMAHLSKGQRPFDTPQLPGTPGGSDEDKDNTDPAMTSGPIYQTPAQPSDGLDDRFRPSVDRLDKTPNYNATNEPNQGRNLQSYDDLRQQSSKTSSMPSPTYPTTNTRPAAKPRAVRTNKYGDEIDD